MSQSGCVTFEYLCDEEGDPLRGFELSFLPGPEWPGAAISHIERFWKGCIYPMG